tara:strand:+ start:1591 stop:1950 length:360 start_codon:yes stop_codon:yes gene_type:complete
MHRTTPAVALAAAALLTLPGCLVVSGKETTLSGAYAAPQDVAQVRIGTTTIDEAVAILGEPSERTADDAGNETLHYHWTKESADGGAVFLIFAGGSNTTVEQSLHIAFKDGVAARKWRD